MKTMVTTLLLALAALPAASETVSIRADRDATLIESADGSLANGSGLSLFVGRTGQKEESQRRGLLRFDVAGAIPKNAIIENAVLHVRMIRGNPGPVEFRLHRLLADWSEGPAISGGGGGAPAQQGDATWLHRSYPDELWVRPGGQYVSRFSATAVVDLPGAYAWGGTNHVVQDVRLWLHNPLANHGWLLAGGEEAGQTVKVFASRELPVEMLQPTLEVTYRLPGRR